MDPATPTPILQARRRLLQGITLQMLFILILTLIAFTHKDIIQEETPTNPRPFVSTFTDSNSSLPKLLYIFIIPINIVCVVFIAASRLSLLAIYLPFRYLFAMELGKGMRHLGM